MSVYKILNEYIEEYKKDSYNTIKDMKDYYYTEDDCWFVIEELLDRIVELENRKV